MKKLLPIILLICLAFTAGCSPRGDNNDDGREPEPGPTEPAFVEDESTTLMIYMIGSDLESKSGAATSDLEEIRASGVDLDINNVIVYAGGTTAWHNEFIPAESNCLLRLEEDGFRVEEEFVKRSMAESSCLSDFLELCVRSCPADNYALILWDHGNGPVMGYGKDTAFENARMSLAALRKALEASPFGEDMKLDFIGFDACLMASAELACVCGDYAYYLVSSQETEPNFGWDYGFLSGLGKRPTAELLSSMADRYLDTCIEYYLAKGYAGSDTTLSVIDLSYADALYRAIDELFIPAAADVKLHFNELAALRANTRGVARATTGSEYDLVDIKSLASQLEKKYPAETSALAEALDRAIIKNATNAEELCGLSLYYPFYNKSYYNLSWAENYRELGLFENYQAYLEEYAVNWLYDGSPDDYAHSAVPEQIADDTFTLLLTPEEREQFAYARYYILRREGEEKYSVVYSAEAEDDGSLLTARFNGNVIYAADDYGYTFIPVAEQLDSVGNRTNYSVPVVLTNRDLYWNAPEGEEDRNEPYRYYISLDHATGSVDIRTLLPWDDEADPDEVAEGKLEEPDLEGWVQLWFVEGRHCTLRRYEGGTLMGVKSWTDSGAFSANDVSAKDGLSFYYAPLSNGRYSLVFDITDTHGDSYCSEPVELQVESEPFEYRPKIPAPEPIELTWDGTSELTVYEDNGVSLKMTIEPNSSGRDTVQISIENDSDRNIYFDGGQLSINGGIYCDDSFTNINVAARSAEKKTLRFGDVQDYGLAAELDSIDLSFTVRDIATCATIVYGQHAHIAFARPIDLAALASYSPTLEPICEASAGRQMLYDCDEYAVELISFGSAPYSSDAACLLRFENLSDRMLYFDCDAVVLNDVCLGAYMEGVYLEPGYSAYAVVKTSDRKNSGVEAVVSAGLYLLAGDNRDTAWLGDAEAIWCDIALSSSAAQPSVFVPGDVLLYEQNGLRIAMYSADRGGYELSNYAQTWYLSVENDTDAAIALVSFNECIDNTESESLSVGDYRTVIGPHQKRRIEVSIGFFSTELCSADAPARQVSFMLRVMNSTFTAELWRSEYPIVLRAPLA